MGERHSPSPSVRIRFSVFVEDSKESAAAAANFGDSDSPVGASESSVGLN